MYQCLNDNQVEKKRMDSPDNNIERLVAKHQSGNHFKWHKEGAPRSIFSHLINKPNKGLEAISFKSASKIKLK